MKKQNKKQPKKKETREELFAVINSSGFHQLESSEQIRIQRDLDEKTAEFLAE